MVKPPVLIANENWLLMQVSTLRFYGYIVQS